MSGPMQWSQAHGALVPATGTIPAVLEHPVAFVPVPVARTATPRPPPFGSPPAPADREPLDVLRLAKARLKEVKSELRRLVSLERERDELERLIAAAQPKKPRATRATKPPANSAG